MDSKRFMVGFNKTSGVAGAVGKKLVNAAGGPLNVGLNALGALAEGAQGYKKMVAAGTR